jgi:hypothetical protein
MKKLYLTLLAAAFMLSSVCLARSNHLDVQEDELQAEKQENKIKRDQSKKQKKQKKEEKRLRETAKKEKRDIDHKSKKERRKEKERARQEHNEQLHATAVKEEQEQQAHKILSIRTERQERLENIDKYKAMRRLEDDRDRAAGKYAYLYKQPAWPLYALFFENKDMLNIEFNYRYVTDCFDSNGSGSKSDITKLAFGEDPITVQNILLASKLVIDGKLDFADPIINPKKAFVAADNYLKYLGDEILNLNGRTESYGLRFGLSRYVINKNIAIGFDIPVVYVKNHLKLDMLLSDNAIEPDNKIDEGAFGPQIDKTRDTTVKGVEDKHPANAFLKRYGADPLRFMKDVLLSKGMTELGGSAMGLGDVDIFINGQFNSVNFDKLITGLRIQFPTGKKATQAKLWAPDLGNGGFPEIAAYGSILMSYKKYLNPHVLAQVSFSLPAHVERRVPHMVKSPDNSSPHTNGNLSEDYPDLMAFGDRVDFISNIPFSAYDTTVKGFSDTITTVKITKGPEFKFRFGNMFERFIAVRGALDLFYDFRGKLKDDISGLLHEEYNTSSLRDHTVEIENRIGFNYSYQFDLYARLNAGVQYTFAGHNVPKALDVNVVMNYSF